MLNYNPENNKINREIISNNKITNLIKRNKGQLNLNPILDS